MSPAGSVLLDTSIVIDHFRGDQRTNQTLQSAKGADARRQTGEQLVSSSGGAPDTAPVLREFLQSAEAIYIPAVVLGELYYGAFRSVQRDRHLEQIRRFLLAVSVLGVDAQTSEEYGRVRADLARDGVLIPENDIWIVAVAVRHKLPLVTRDQHFGRIPGLRVMSW